MAGTLSRDEALGIAKRLQELGNDAAKDVRKLTGERVNILDILKTLQPVYDELAAIGRDLFREGRD